MVDDLDCLPPWVTWQQRPFPDANLLLLPGRNPALVDSGFVGHADQTADWVHARTGQLSLVVNTHWHADHVGGNGMLQAKGAGIRSTLTAPTWMSTPPWRTIRRSERAGRRLRNRNAGLLARRSWPRRKRGRPGPCLAGGRPPETGH